ncbi:zinc finger protein 567-like [Cotesia glomerata]|uniref:zinc finger protein 567-like n=1 Tax=Cotesia glomerata TaxID=32391 RepID=UPI001D024949|nr:zinc finger protein 567-like [Cotesia glomerata]
MVKIFNDIPGHEEIFPALEDSEEITLDQSVEFSDESKENEEEIPLKNSTEPVKPKKTSKKIVGHSKTAKRRFSCATYSRSFPVKSTLIRHINECGKEKKYSCPYCKNWRAHRKYHLKVHLIHVYEFTTMVTIFNDFPGHEETFPVKEEDGLDQLHIKNIKYACYNLKCNLKFKSERQRDKHSFDCWNNNLQPGEITLDQNAKFRDESKDDKEKIPSKNSVKPVKPKKTSKKIVHLYKIVDGRFSCCKCSRSYKYRQELTTMETSFNDFPGHEETFPVEEEDDLNQLMIKNIKYACHNLKCNLTFKSERQRDKHSFDCLKNNLQSEEITVDQNAKFRAGSKENKEKIPLKNSIEPVNRRQKSRKIVGRFKTTKRRFSCSTCLRSYKYKQNLNLHMKVECGKEKTCICPICKNWRTYHQHNLRKHMNTVHGKKL